MKIPAYCLHRATDQAFLTLPVEPGRPRRTPVYLGVHGTAASVVAYRDALVGYGVSAPDADAAAAAVRLHLDCPAVAAAGGSPTLSRLYREYLVWAESYYRLPTGVRSREVDNVRDSFRDFLDLLGDRPTASLSRRDVVAVRDRMVARGLSRGVVNQRVRRVVAALVWGTDGDRGLVPDSVAAAARLVRPLPAFRSAARETGPVPPAPARDVDAAIEAAGRPVNAMLTLQILLGLRPGEARGVRRRMVQDRDDRHVIDYGVEHKMAHRRRLRIVPVSDAAWAVLVPYLDAEPDQFLFRPEMAACGRGRVRHAQYTRHSYIQAVARACARAGVPTFAPNQVRHRVGFDVRRELGLDYAQALLGHASAATTERYYAPVDTAKAAEAARSREPRPPS